MPVRSPPGADNMATPPHVFASTLRAAMITKGRRGWRWGNSRCRGGLLMYPTVRSEHGELLIPLHVAFVCPHRALAYSPEVLTPN